MQGHNEHLLSMVHSSILSGPFVGPSLKEEVRAWGWGGELQRTHVLFTIPILGGSQPPLTPAPRHLTHSAGLQGHLLTALGYLHNTFAEMNIYSYK